MNKNILTQILIVAIIIVLIGLAGYIVIKKIEVGRIVPLEDTEISPVEDEQIRAFASDKEFKDYLSKGSAIQGVGFGMGRGGFPEAVSDVAMEKSAGTAFSNQLSLSAPSRVSETNVQTLNIDEPDIVKTNGREIYFSREGYYRGGIMPMRESVVSDNAGVSKEIAPGIMPPDYESQQAVKILEAFPLEKLEKIGEIKKNGTLLLEGDVLAIFTYQGVYGYDVKNPAEPKEKWNISYKDGNQLVTARLYDGKIYLVTSNWINSVNPCPVEVYSVNGVTYPIRCENIYHPATVLPVNTAYTVSIVDPASGDVKEAKSFVGTSGSSAVYMSEKNIYVTYSYPGDVVRYTHNFFKENSDLVPQEIIDRLEKLQGYDISFAAKMTEMSMIINDYQQSLSNDERLKMENEMKNRGADFAKNHRRELERTGITKLDAKNLNIEANGSVPGNLLNQFSLDEFKGNLRVAVTIGQGFGSFGFGGRNETANDVYVLNENLDEAGSVKDLGLGERIYSVRFIGERGYVVTFKQIDPFFVLDLSDPKNPQQKGELKIPGFSSYLHPLDDNHILGVGTENNQVKLSLFDVSDPQDPRELSKYNLDEYWTEVSNNHRAFLLDKKHTVFFLPGSKGGYVFSYEDNQLKLAKAVSDVQVKRALYINDYLYILSEKGVTVLDEKNWEKVKELELQ